MNPTPLSKALRVVALVAILSAAFVYESYRVAAFSSVDVWGHLRIGFWILSNHAVPDRGVFSQVPDRRWVDSSWGFQVLLAEAYRVFGLRSVCLLLMLFKFFLAAVTFLLAGGWRKNIRSAILLSVAAQYVLLDLPLIPMVCSVLCFGIELLLLLESRRRCDTRYLYWLPPLFLLWANLHIQFVNGLLLLGLFLAAEVAERVLRKSGFQAFPGNGLSLAGVLTAALLSLAATLVTPNLHHLFPESLTAGYGAAQFKYFAEMHALQFRQPQDFVLLLLVMGAFLALGLQRPRDLFQCALMVVFAMLAFRVARDVWCAALPAIASIASALPESSREGVTPRLRSVERGLVAGLCLLALVLAFIRTPSDQVLLRRAGRSLPIKACNFIRENQLPGPLFNTSSWSGFLIWYLPEYPVSIDSRLTLYGEKANQQYFNLMDGTSRLEENASFVNARTILLEENSGLAKGLTTLPVLRGQFHVAYQDDLAVVLVKN